METLLIALRFVLKSLQGSAIQSREVRRYGEGVRKILIH